MGSLVSVDPRHPTPVYVQLEHGLRAAIATGRLVPGDQLPTVRQMAVDLRLNANTVARVYLELERTGLVETRRGVGTFVTDAPASPKSGTPSSPRCWRRRSPPSRSALRRASPASALCAMARQARTKRGSYGTC